LTILPTLSLSPHQRWVTQQTKRNIDKAGELSNEPAMLHSFDLDGCIDLSTYDVHLVRLPQHRKSINVFSLKQGADYIRINPMLVPVNHPLLYTKIYCYITASTTAVIRQIAHLKFSSSGLLTRLLDWYPIVLLENTLKNQQVVSVRVLRVMENSKDVGPFYPPS
jgi:hypothetical protein